MKLSILKDHATSFKVLGHVKRLEIACLLHGHSLTVNQIVQMSGLRQSAVSQHLMLLKQCNLVSTTKLGKEIYYSLAKKKLSSLSDFVYKLSRIKPIEDSEPSVIDPICKMYLTPSSANYTAEYNGVRHYFCGSGCRKEFYVTHKI